MSASHLTREPGYVVTENDKIVLHPIAVLDVVAQQGLTAEAMPGAGPPLSSEMDNALTVRFYEPGRNVMELAAVGAS